MNERPTFAQRGQRTGRPTVRPFVCSRCGTVGEQKVRLTLQALSGASSNGVKTPTLASRTLTVCEPCAVGLFEAMEQEFDA